MYAASMLQELCIFALKGSICSLFVTCLLLQVATHCIISPWYEHNIFKYIMADWPCLERRRTAALPSKARSGRVPLLVFRPSHIKTNLPFESIK